MFDKFYSKQSLRTMKMIFKAIFIILIFCMTSSNSFGFEYGYDTEHQKIWYSIYDDTREKIVYGETDVRDDIIKQLKDHSGTIYWIENMYGDHTSIFFIHYDSVDGVWIKKQLDFNTEDRLKTLIDVKNGFFFFSTEESSTGNYQYIGTYAPGKSEFVLTKAFMGLKITQIINDDSEFRGADDTIMFNWVASGFVDGYWQSQVCFAVYKKKAEAFVLDSVDLVSRSSDQIYNDLLGGELFGWVAKAVGSEETNRVYIAAYNPRLDRFIYEYEDIGSRITDMILFDPDNNAFAWRAIHNTEDLNRVYLGTYDPQASDDFLNITSIELGYKIPQDIKVMIKGRVFAWTTRTFGVDENRLDMAVYRDNQEDFLIDSFLIGSLAPTEILLDPGNRFLVCKAAGWKNGYYQQAVYLAHYDTSIDSIVFQAVDIGRGSIGSVQFSIHFLLWGSAKDGNNYVYSAFYDYYRHKFVINTRDLGSRTLGQFNLAGKYIVWISTDSLYRPQDFRIYHAVYDYNAKKVCVGNSDDFIPADSVSLKSLSVNSSSVVCVVEYDDKTSKYLFQYSFTHGTWTTQIISTVNVSSFWSTILPVILSSSLKHRK